MEDGIHFFLTVTEIQSHLKICGHSCSHRRWRSDCCGGTLFRLDFKYIITKLFRLDFNILKSGHIDQMQFSLPMIDCILTPFSELASQKWWSQKPCRIFVHFGARARLVDLQMLMYSNCCGNLHTNCAFGATIGLLSSQRWVILDGILQSTRARVFTVLPRKSKFQTPLPSAPKICQHLSEF